MRDRWEIVGKAVGETAGEIQFCIAAPRYGGWDGLRDTKRAGDVHSIRVPLTTIDAEWKRLGSPTVSCMKIDVEGAEIGVLKGSREMMRQSRPYVLLEWSVENLAAYQINPAVLLSFADGEGYDVAALPDLLPVSSPNMLGVQMHITESFLLVPR